MSFLSVLYPGDAVIWLALVVAVQAAVVVGVAWLMASLGARRRPALRHAIWLGALFAVSLTPLVSCGVARMGLTAWSIAGYPITADSAQSRPGQFDSQLLASGDERARNSTADLETTGPRPPVSDDGHGAAPVESSHSWSTPAAIFRAFGGALTGVCSARQERGGVNESFNGSAPIVDSRLKRWNNEQRNA
jgi:hypothetical protein